MKIRLNKLKIFSDWVISTIWFMLLLSTINFIFHFTWGCILLIVAFILLNMIEKKYKNQARIMLTITDFRKNVCVLNNTGEEAYFRAATRIVLFNGFSNIILFLFTLILLYVKIIGIHITWAIVLYSAIIAIGYPIFGYILGLTSVYLGYKLKIVIP